MVEKLKYDISSLSIMKNNSFWVFFFGFIFVQIKLEAFKKEGSEFVSSPAKKRKMRSLDFPVDLELEHVLGSMPRKVRATPSIKTHHYTTCQSVWKINLSLWP